MSNIKYDRTLFGGLKIAEHADAVLARIDEAATLKELAGSLTKGPNSTAPAAGDNKKMLEIGYAAGAVECSVDQNAGTTPGNVLIGDIYKGDVTSFEMRVDSQDDQGGSSHMVCTKLVGIPVEDELMTNQVTNSATGKIIVGTLVLAPGGGDGKYQGEIAIGAEAGSGDALYDAIVAAMDGLTALRDEYVKIFQGG